jgi:hypothetical protein
MRRKYTYVIKVFDLFYLEDLDELQISHPKFNQDVLS